MTLFAAPIGIAAFLNLAASTCCAMTQPDPTLCRGGRDVPELPTDQPAPCHAMLACAKHRKGRTAA